MYIQINTCIQHTVHSLQNLQCKTSGKFFWKKNATSLVWFILERVDNSYAKNWRYMTLFWPIRIGKTSQQTARRNHWAVTARQDAWQSPGQIVASKIWQFLPANWEHYLQKISPAKCQSSRLHKNARGKILHQATSVPLLFDFSISSTTLYTVFFGSQLLGWKRSLPDRPSIS